MTNKELVWEPGTQETDWHGAWRLSPAAADKRDAEYITKHPEIKAVPVKAAR